MVFRIVLSIEDCLMVGIRILVGLFGWICMVTLLMVKLDLDASEMKLFPPRLEGCLPFYLQRRRWERITEHLIDATLGNVML
jgi:hypothetical protein